jgi:hypothetical protein
LKASVGQATLPDYEIGGTEVAGAIGHTAAEESGGGQRESMSATDGSGADLWTDRRLHHQT